MKKSHIAILVFTGILSSIFVIIGSLQMSGQQLLVEEGIKANATVVEVINKQSDNSSPVYYPVVEFLADGKKERQEINYGTNPSEYQVGDLIPIIYEREDVSNILINTPFTMNFFAWVFIGVGFFIQVAGAIVFVVLRSSDKKASSVVTSVQSKEKAIYDKSSDKDKENPFLM